MSRPLRIVELARSDVDHIFNWLVHRSIQGAISWYLAFLNMAEEIGASPESFAVAPESNPLRCPLRQALFKTRRGRIYRIVFEISEFEIMILRVRGPGQSPLRTGDLPNR
jgi:plasmid stabilization system protein ParE